MTTTVEWVSGRLDHPVTVADLAAHAGMSARTFARRFRAEMGVAPHQWLIGRRVALAQRLLETTDASVEIIARKCGFGTAASLRQHFRREMRTTPSNYRAGFGSNR